MSCSLAEAFKVRRRYSRSINLERDLGAPGTLDGYLLSPLALEATERVFSAWATPGAPKAWTITGVYGTGKSAFAHFLCSFMGSARSTMRRDALGILEAAPESGALPHLLRKVLGRRAILQAVATGAREPLCLTVLRALERAARQLAEGRSSEVPAVVEHVLSLAANSRDSRVLPGSSDVVAAALDLAQASDGGLFLIIDELGKCLEYAARDASGADDVYLLQQLAESTAGDARFGIIGLLHQGFGEYGAGLALDRRTEWLKIQGRFEDIVFTQPPEQMLRLMASAIEHDDVSALTADLARNAIAWSAFIAESGCDRHVAELLSPGLTERLLPLHPVAALVLPSLCSKYAQNDRSLFTFLASQEPHAFGRFLRQTSWDGEQLPLQRLDDVYDYFAGIAGQAMGFRPQFQRWAEVHAVVSDARNLDADSVAVIKTVAALNLTAASGPLRASRALTVAALVVRPGDAREVARWETALASLVERGLLTYRRQLDEYRLWEGSDFDVEAAIHARLSKRRFDVAKVLSGAVPLGPLVAQRHSYRTGTLRYFERRYADDSAAIGEVRCEHDQSDGVLLYWIGRGLPEAVPTKTADGRPVVLVEARSVATLGDAAAEYMALEEIAQGEPHLQADGVARREVRHRQRIAREALDRTVRDSLFKGALRCHLMGLVSDQSATELRARLSDLCDEVYSDSLTLWNELINRRDLTSQGAKARRVLIEAMLRNGSRRRLGLTGNGPETSMYASVLEGSGIHRQEEGRWIFGAPTDPRFRAVWDAMESFCRSADSPRPVDSLFTMLQRPPFGVKAGVLPVLFTAVLLADPDGLSLYRDGSFLPQLGAEHFEVLVKHPGKFSVKYFSLVGLRGEVFQDLEQAVRSATRESQEQRTSSVLGVVRPLVQFATSLPQITLKTATLSPTAAAVRDALLTAREPDSLIFYDLPVACGLTRIAADDVGDPEFRAEYRGRLLAALRELQSFQSRQRDRCLSFLHAAFGVSRNPLELRADLGRRVRSLGAEPLEPRMRALVAAARDDAKNEIEWLDALIMIVADKPLRSWDDRDAEEFEGRLADFARRFRNLEAIHTATGAAEAGADVRRVTITAPNGRDVHRVVWIGASEKPVVRATASSLLDQLEELPRNQREAVLALMAERLLADGQDSPAEMESAGSPPAHESYCLRS